MRINNLYRMSSDNYANMLERCIDSLKSCKELVYKHLKNDEEIVSTIQELTKGYCDVNFEVEKSDRALTKLRIYIDKSTNLDIDIDKLYEEYCTEDETELIYTDAGIWKEIFSEADITEVKQKNKKLSDMAYERVDDSLLCSNIFEPPKDPISKTIIKEPYKNRICGHIFEYEFILNYIKEKKNKAKCPYVGCTNVTFRASDLRPDHKLKMQVSQYLETHKSDIDSSEDE